MSFKIVKYQVISTVVQIIINYIKYYITFYAGQKSAV